MSEKLMTSTLPQGSTIGILGGGQLGRMTALAAARLGYQYHIFCQSPDEPAAQIAHNKTIASFEDMVALKSFAETVDLVTLEFENIPLSSFKYLESIIEVRPNSHALSISQDRVKEKNFISNLGIEVAPFRSVKNAADLNSMLTELGTPSILKTARMGYDGKGQIRIDKESQTQEAWNASGACNDTGGAILEGLINFEREISVISARGSNGDIVSYIPVENIHKNHILNKTIAPAPISPEQVENAMQISHCLIENLKLIGLLAVEMFITKDGRLLVNEIAPRPHNSGHWTLDACAISQFDLLIRALCGLPLGSVKRSANATMQNLIGDNINDWQDYLLDPTAHLHIYGKSKARKGRKMGHVTWISSIT
jgi:5-(carboxyamino)imidazole ribonucleotide synthase